jgi:ABC-2 type transport system ATP-binding protein
VIEATTLTRRFGRLTAVDAVSFRAAPGVVTGFLGPNGAGKTTTLRLLTTFLAPTSGRATVAGFDIVERPLEVRRRVGYLCENAPLPAELRVGEYLRLRAELKGLDRAGARRAVGRELERLALGRVERRLAGQLSRGFRQRVGLADALLADPPVLVLDEPTISLDPDQVRRVRALLRELAAERTVFLSTHLLAEAERICGSLVIVARGRVVAAGTPAEIAERHGGQGEIVVRVGKVPAGCDVAAVLGKLAAFAQIHVHGLAPAPGTDPAPEPEHERDRVHIHVHDHDDEDVLPRVVKALVEAGVEVREAGRGKATLERVFLDLTAERDSGSGIRDSGEEPASDSRTPTEGAG